MSAVSKQESFYEVITGSFRRRTDYEANKEAGTPVSRYFVFYKIALSFFYTQNYQLVLFCLSS